MKLRAHRKWRKVERAELIGARVMIKIRTFEQRNCVTRESGVV